MDEEVERHSGMSGVNNKRRLMLEKMLLRYSAALEDGDFAAAAVILQAAETDRELEGMILELNDCYAGESESVTLAGDGALAGAVIHSALASAHPQRLFAAPARYEMPLLRSRSLGESPGFYLFAGEAPLDGEAGERGAEEPGPDDQGSPGDSKEDKHST